MIARLFAVLGFLVIISGFTFIAIFLTYHGVKEKLWVGVWIGLGFCFFLIAWLIDIVTCLQGLIQ